MARWVSVKEAAAILGVSEDTVKRRVKAGQMHGRKETLLGGYRWLVEVGGVHDAHPPPQAHREGDAPLPPQQDTVRLEQMVEMLERHIRVLEENQTWMRGELEARRREVSELHILLQRSQRPEPPAYLPRVRSHPTVMEAAAQLLVVVRQSRWFRTWTQAGAERG